MKTLLKNTFSRLKRDERGVTLVEYGVAVAFAVAVGAAGLTVLETDFNAAMGAAGTAMAN
ncbi:hypothetical protein ATO8_11314 [Roseivivax marinus]|uniref:Flp/Fap pilin component n=1 Tax=Roseivivax marinus TaxID=1379903 RepID=W4HJK5_9RHOB|nr:hypothetical protein [Roseivivax marinus]ETW12603.1 hypothetical protein ATO8_11314 [Roseivivax marinus]UMA65805.1 hypothetical protein LVO79_04895 [Roseivivax marinus]